jgi:hypothetical protein
VTDLGGPALVVCYLVCQVLDPMRSQATYVPSDGPCNVRSLLSCTWSI